MFTSKFNNCIPIYPLWHIFDIISLFAAELEEPKIGISGEGWRWQNEYSSKLEVLERIENIVGNGENAGIQNFFFISHNVFKSFLP